YKQAWYNKGYTFHGINRLEEAVTAYEKAIELDRGDEVLWNNLGNALYNLGRYGESIPYFEQGLEVNPKYEIAWNNIGNALNKMVRHSEALEYHEKAVELKPEFDYALYAKAHALDNLGLHEEDLERTDEAIDAYAASASRGHSTDALIRLSALLLRVGRAADALVPADEARSRHPLDGRGHLAAGRAAIALNRTADAEAFFRKALDVDPASEARLELARVLHLIGKE